MLTAFIWCYCLLLSRLLSEQLFIAHFSIFTELVYLQRWHGWCHVKLLPSWRVLLHHTTMHRVASCKATLRHVHACFAVTCHLNVWQTDWDLSCATAVTRGRMDTEIRVSTEGCCWRRKFSCSSTTVESRVWCSNHWTIPASLVLHNKCI